MGTQKNRLSETVLLSTQNVCLNCQFKKINKKINLKFYQFFLPNFFKEKIRNFMIQIFHLSGPMKERFRRQKTEKGERENKSVYIHATMYNYYKLKMALCKLVVRLWALS